MEGNGPMTLSNDEIADWIRQYRTQKRRCSEENGVARGMLKRAKAQGVNLKALIAAADAGKFDPEEIARDLSDTARYLQAANIDLPDDLFTRMEVSLTQKSRDAWDIWDAEEQGYKSGRGGATIDDCPFELGSELYAGWVKFWHKGQAAIASELGPDGEMAAAPRKRRATQTRIPGTEPRIGKNGEAPARRRRRSITDQSAAA